MIDTICNKEYKNYEFDPFHLGMETALKKLKYPNPPDEKTERDIKISLTLIFFTLCVGFELHNQIIEDFWEELKIEDVFERFDYLIEKYPTVIIKGPLSEMAQTAIVQLSMHKSKSRGLVHDCFHSVYCYYANNFITGDAHFKSLRETTKHPAFERIIMVEEAERIWAKTKKKLTKAPT